MIRAPRLRRLRERRLLSQAELAELANVMPSVISRIENGAEARGSTLRKIARALDVTPDQLLGPDREEDDEAPKKAPERQLVTA